jgi:hypothetical protein
MKKAFFFEKRTKKLLLVAIGIEAACVLKNKSFLLLFCKKEVLSLCRQRVEFVY